MTYRSMASCLRNAGVDNCFMEARLLIERFTGIPEEKIIADPERDYGGSELLCALEERKEGRPLQYILGSWGFMGLEFRVGEGCLIPRSETEILCGIAINTAPAGARVLDLCTGSGNIAVSVKKYRPDLNVTAVEKYEDALEYAVQNSKEILGEDGPQFIKGDVTDPSFAQSSFEKGSFDLILSNPPYVSSCEMESLQKEVRFEPEHALTDFGDGLGIIRAICRIYPAYLKPGGRIAIEHSDTQGEKVRDLFKGSAEVRTVKDLAGLDRVTEAIFI